MTGLMSRLSSVSGTSTAMPAITLRSFSRLPASVTQNAPTKSVMIAMTGKCI